MTLSTTISAANVVSALTKVMCRKLILLLDAPVALLTGYMKDAGHEFAERASGYLYGWNDDNFYGCDPNPVDLVGAGADQTVPGCIQFVVVVLQ